MPINSDLMDIVPTKASLLKNNIVKEFRATVFETYKPKLKVENVNNKVSSHENEDLNDESEEVNINKKRRKNNDTEFNIKRAKHEVINFAISGSNTKDKKAAQIALSIKLGAKPPKKPYINYKELLKQKESKKLTEEKIGKFSLLGKNQYGASITKCNNRRKRNKVISQISKHYGVANPKMKKK